MDKEIQVQLRKADLVLLLISPDFLDSDYCYCVEMQSAIERHSDGRSIVVPIMLRHADWTRTPFSRLKALPEDARPVATWTDRDEAWLSVATGLRHAIEARIARSDAQESPAPAAKTLRESLKENFQALQERYEAAGELRNLAFGIPELDEATNGISRGDLILVAARPASALFDFLLHIATWSILKYKQAVFLASPRQRSQRISQRMLCQIGRIRTHDLERGLLEDEDWARINLSIKLLSGADINIFDQVDFDLDQLERALDANQANRPLGLLIVDGLEYLSDGRAGTEVAISRRLRSIARRHEVAVVASLSLGPHVDARFGQRPMLSDLREWHSFESDADKIVFLCRSQDDDSTNLRFDLLDALVAKNSDGPRASFPFKYWEEYGSIGWPTEAGQPSES